MYRAVAKSALVGSSMWGGRWTVRRHLGGGKLTSSRIGHYFVQLMDGAPQPQMHDRVYVDASGQVTPVDEPGLAVAMNVDFRGAGSDGVHLVRLL